MTAATATRPLAPRRSPLRPRGTVWTALRVHGTALWIWAALVTATSAALLWPYGPGADGVREWNRTVARCSLEPTCVDPALDGPAYGFYDLVATTATSAIVYLPCLVAAWAGATLVARDLENGTAALAWTQSVTPARWLAAQLAVPAALVTAGTTLLVLLHRLMWNDGRELLAQEWYEPDVFRANGTVTVAAALCALAVGALAGMLLRRTLPALGLAVAVTVALLILEDLFRDGMWPAVTVTGAAVSRLPDSAELLERGVVLASGERVARTPACLDGTGADLRRCMSENGVSDLYAVHHPSSHFWPLQLTETAVLLAVAALAVFLTFRALKRRTA
ncbi:ABC transporter permease [Streptomyces sp. NPDC057757]|uniref:ABC transporter permease n=1 Tax=Streptomyces sp. NPDC057757 TaxID=3346241 RepID=UPI0036AC2C33